MNTIPPELIGRILRFLPPTDLFLSTTLVCRLWNRLSIEAISPTGRIPIALNLSLSTISHQPILSVTMSALTREFFLVPDPERDGSRRAVASCDIHFSKAFVYLVASGTPLHDLIVDFALSSTTNCPLFPLDVEWLVCDVDLQGLGPHGDLAGTIVTALDEVLQPTSLALYDSSLRAWSARNVRMSSVKHVRVDQPHDDECLPRALRVFPKLSSIGIDSMSRIIRGPASTGRRLLPNNQVAASIMGILLSGSYGSAVPVLAKRTSLKSLCAGLTSTFPNIRHVGVLEPFHRWTWDNEPAHPASFPGIETIHTLPFGIIYASYSPLRSRDDALIFASHVRVLFPNLRTIVLHLPINEGLDNTQSQYVEEYATVYAEWISQTTAKKVLVAGLMEPRWYVGQPAAQTAWSCPALEAFVALLVEALQERNRECIVVRPYSGGGIARRLWILE